VRHFGSDRTRSGLITDVIEPTTMTQKRHERTAHSNTSSVRKRSDVGVTG
jgi:hypothetical protein